MITISMDMLQTAALAMILFLLGRFIVSRVEFLQRCCIPAPVVGGLVFAIVHLVTHQMQWMEVEFDETLRIAFMNFFFTSVGFGASFKLLKKGSVAVLLFTALATVLLVGQNIIGAVVAPLFGESPLLGLCMGSIPLVGGHGSSASWGPVFTTDYGVMGAEVVALACATYGLVAGSLMGGPLGRAKIKKYNLTPDMKEVEKDSGLGEPETVYTTRSEKLDSDTILDGFVLIVIASGVGTYITNFCASIHITLPTYIGSLLVALIIRNIADATGRELPLKAIDVMGNTCLNVFLGIALMTLKLWQLASLALPIIVILALETVWMFLFANFVVFKAMGGDYEAAVMTSAICGFGMGATPNAMANMLTIRNRFGPAPKAFFVVPLVGGMFIDLVNTGVIILFVNFLKIA